MNLRSNVKIVNASPEEKKQYMLAVEEMLYELNSGEFWAEVQAKWNTFTHKNGISFYDYKRLVLSGRDQYETVDDGEIDIMVTYYYSWRSVIGYTYASTYKTWFNRKFKGMTVPEFAGHVFHENGGHNLGFDHPNGDRQSLVYQTGFIMRDCIMRRYGQHGAKPIGVKRPSLWSRFKSWLRRIF